MGDQEIYSDHSGDYLVRDIHPAESLFLEMGRGRWPEAKFLDLGVGAGRTTWVFGALVESYIGIDRVPAMIEVCRTLFAETPRRRFLLGDATNLEAFESGTFDAVLFSFNGIDHLELEERRKALKEIRRVLRPDGLFLFSSHNLRVFPQVVNAPLWGPRVYRWPRRWLELRREQRFYSGVNDLVRREEALRRGWAILPDKAHGGSWKVFYVTPDFQKRELEDVGFRLDRVVDVEGKTVEKFDAPSRSWWLNYLCRV